MSNPITTLDVGAAVDARTDESYLEIKRLHADGSLHSRVAVRRVDLPRFVEQLKRFGAQLIGAEEIKRLFVGDETTRAQQLTGVKSARRRR